MNKHLGHPSRPFKHKTFLRHIFDIQNIKEKKNKSFIEIEEYILKRCLSEKKLSLGHFEDIHNVQKT